MFRRAQKLQVILVAFVLVQIIGGKDIGKGA
jgi:hypothetical protein